MKMKKFLIALSLLILSVSIYASEYGSQKAECEVRYVVAVGSPSVKAAPSSNSATIGKVEVGDIIYVDQREVFEIGDERWVKISGSEYYVSEDNLRQEANPHYVSKNKKSYNIWNGMKVSTVPPWITVTIVVLTFLLSMAVIVPLTYSGNGIMGPLRKPHSHKYNDSDSELIYGEGMHRNVFLSSELYKLFLTAAGVFILSFIVSVLLFLIVGSLIWLLSWTGCILLYILYWVIGIGVILAALCLVFYLFSENEGFLTLVIGIPCLGLAIGIAIAIFGNLDDLYDFADSVAEFGNDVFATFNVFSAAWELIVNYWIMVVIVAFAPLCLFLACAVFYLLFAGVLILYEATVMKRYNVKHPCPTCGRPSEPAEYYSHGIPLPVSLRPGPWGLFHIVHPATSEKMPTLFLTGKDNYARKCPHCNTFIRANVGIERHIAVAGVPASGKTTLLYRMISEMLRKRIGNETVCRFTDKAGSDEASLQAFLRTIENGEKMSAEALKTTDGRHKAIQLLVNNPKNMLPYRLYFNDVAGEFFTTNSGSIENDAVSYLRNTNLIIFVIDPFTMKKLPAFSPKMEQWHNENVASKADMSDGFDLIDAVQSLLNNVEKFRSKKEASKISVMFTFTKADSGYLKGVDTGNAGELKKFAVDEMGLGSVIQELYTSFENISFHAVQAVKEANVSGVPEMMEDVYEKLDISFKNVTEGNLHDNRMKVLNASSSADNKSGAVPEVYRHIKPGWGLAILSSFMIFLIWGIFVGTPLVVRSVFSERNYTEVTAAVENIMRTNSKDYGQAKDRISESLENDVLTKKHRVLLENAYEDYNRKYTTYVSELLGKVKTNFIVSGGRACAAEISAKYRVTDNLKKIRENLDYLKSVAPDNKEYQKYEEQFQAILKKYKIEL